MKTSTHLAVGLLALSMLTFTTSASAQERPVECEPNSLIGQSLSTAGLGIVGTVTGVVAGGFIGGMVDTTPIRGGELVNDGATYGALAGGAIGSVVGSTFGAMSGGGNCSTSATFTWTVAGSTIAGATAAGLLLASTVIDGDAGDRLGAFGFGALFLAPAIGAIIGYNLNYPEIDSLVLSPMPLPGGGGLVLGGRF